MTRVTLPFSGVIHAGESCQYAEGGLAVVLAMCSCGALCEVAWDGCDPSDVREMRNESGGANPARCPAIVSKVAEAMGVDVAVVVELLDSSDWPVLPGWREDCPFCDEFWLLGVHARACYARELLRNPCVRAVEANGPWPPEPDYYGGSTPTAAGIVAERRRLVLEAQRDHEAGTLWADEELPF